MDQPISCNQISEEESCAFIGKNAEYYLDKWKTHQDTFYKGWNWAAAIFRVEWMVYRKMYLEAAVALIIIIVLGIAIDVILALVNLRVSDSVGRGAVQVLIGVYANGLYYKKAVRAINKTSHMDSSQRINYSTEKGGTNPVGLVILIGLELLVVLLPILML